MTEDPIPFDGFPKATLTFYRGLKKNNNKKWFETHRDDFDENVMASARSFVFEMGLKLRTITPDIQADPRVNKSVFKIHRDTRFAKDKTPFKTHLALLFWRGSGGRMESPSFYFHLEDRKLIQAAGLYHFPKDVLSRCREAVDSKRQGEELTRLLIKILRIKGLELGGQNYKKLPRGFESDHPRHELLLHDGPYLWSEEPLPGEVHSRKLLAYAFKKYKAMTPVTDWLMHLV